MLTGSASTRASLFIRRRRGREACTRVGIKGGEVPATCVARIPDTADWRARGITKCTGEMHPPQLRGSEAPMPLNRDVCAFSLRYGVRFGAPSTTYYRDLPSTRPRSARQYYRECIIVNRSARSAVMNTRVDHAIINDRLSYSSVAFAGFTPISPNRYLIGSFSTLTTLDPTLVTTLGKFRLSSSFRLFISLEENRVTDTPADRDVTYQN